MAYADAIPRVVRGMLPGGVRTFLFIPNDQERSDRPSSLWRLYTGYRAIAIFGCLKINKKICWYLPRDSFLQ